MIGLDTNALVRLIIEDDIHQAALVRDTVRRLIASGRRCFVNRVVLIEFVWVMEKAAKRSRMDICGFLDAILNTDHLLVEDRDTAVEALDRYRTGPAGFADALIAIGNRAKGCETTLTFDRKAARLPEFQPLA